MKRLLRRCIGQRILLRRRWHMAECARLSRIRQAFFVLGGLTMFIFARWLWISVDKETPEWHHGKRVVIVTGNPQTKSPCERFSVTSTKKIILIWNMPFDDPAMVPETLFTGQLPKDLYSISWNDNDCGNCQITYDQEMLNNSDAVIFHGAYSNETDFPPSLRRSKNRKLIWWSQESRLNVEFGDVEKEDFDWTMTPSRHSDVFSPYSTFSWILKFLWLKEHGSDVMTDFCEMKSLYMAEEDELDDLLDEYFGDAKKKKRQRKTRHSKSPLDELLSKKLKPYAWIASNCRTISSLNRLYMVEKMEEYGIEVTRYGACNGHYIDLSRWDPSFFEILSRFKFYLSFENSLHCSDYITEKLWFNALYSGAVPVIWGPHRDDVEAALPPKSYVFVEDFSSIKDLVKYLKYLDRNETAYAEYLQWRTWVKYLDNFGEYNPDELKKSKHIPQPDSKTKKLLKKYASMKPVGFCQLCLKLHTPSSCLKRPKGDFVHDEREECLDVERAEEIVRELGI